MFTTIVSTNTKRAYVPSKSRSWQRRRRAQRVINRLVA